MPRPVLLALLVASFSHAVQEAHGVERQLVRGSVVGADGKPWGDTTVRLWARIGRDSLEVRTDEHGEFRAELQRGVGYDAWGHRMIDENSFLATGFRSSIWAGDRVRLVGDAVPRSVLRVRLTGLEAWNAHGGLRVFVAGDEVRPDDDGTIAIRPLAADAWVSCTRKDGLAVFGASVGKPTTLQIPPPARCALRIVDLRNAPLRGAELVHESKVLARADANGLLAYIGCATGGEALWTPGCAIRAPGKTTMWLTPTRRKATAVGGVLGARQQLGDGFPLTGNIVGPPPEHLLLWAPKGHPMEGGGASELVGSRPTSITIGPDRKFRSESFPAVRPWMLGVRLGPKVIDELSGDGLRIAPVAIVAYGDPTVFSRAVDDLDLTKLRLCEIRVEHEDGSRASRADVVFSTCHSQGVLELRCDRHGRARVLLPERGSFHVAARQADGIALQLVEASAVWKLVLTRRRTVSGHVVDRAGKPVPGAYVQAYIRPQTAESPERLLSRLPQRFRARTGEDGKFRILSPLRDGEVTLLATHIDRAGKLRSIGCVVDLAARDLGEVEIRFR